MENVCDSTTICFEGEETLSTEMGDVRTLHIANVKATSDEKTELWLAVDYRNFTRQNS